jgi:hypothetical protein
MRRRSQLLAPALVLPVIVFAPAGAGAQEPGDDDTSTLTAVVAATTGRTIAFVTPPTASVMRGATEISAGTPGVVEVAEVGADGSADWYVTVEMLDQLTDTTDGSNTLGNDLVTAQSSTSRVCVLPDVACSGLTLDDADNAAAHLGAPLTLFTVGGQTAEAQYTATYTSTVDFTVDASDYEGPLAPMTAPIQVTVYQ